ncbi:ABC transporter substrate-binding protein [Desulfobacterales bacterium HSG17]|nr:ABC transporter substrate-binding protein [Desulfobacterales bacterium HSG17]
MQKIRISLLSIIFVICLCINANAYVLRLQWTPQAQFAGYYMAAEQGFYKDLGLDIIIEAGGPGIFGLRELVDKKMDFATSWLVSAVRIKANGVNLVHIGQVFQKSALMLIAKKSSKIDSIQKFSGHSLGVWPGDFQLLPKALLRKNRIKNVKVINQDFSMEPFIKGEIDIASAMRYNEYHQVLESGIKPDELIVFDYAQLEMNLPEDGIYVHEDFFKQNKEVCKKFVQASFKGWKYAFEHKDETVKFITDMANKTPFKSTEKKQRIMLDEVEKLIDLNDSKLKEKDFQTANEILKTSRIIKKDVSYKEFTGN